MPTITGTAGNDVLSATTGGTLTLVSTNASGTAQNGQLNGSYVVSPDGKWLLFATSATNLTTDDTGGQSQLYLKNLVTGQVTLVSVTAGGVIGNGGAFPVSFSTDLSKIYFLSFGSNVALPDTDHRDDSYVKDLTTGVITEIGLAPGGEDPNSHHVFTGQNFGGRMLFTSDANNLIAGDTNGMADIFILDTATSQWTRISTSSSGDQSNNHSGDALFSPDGTKVAFRSTASNLVAGDTNGVSDIFLKDLATGAVTRISTSAAGLQANGASAISSVGWAAGEFSRDGSKFLFHSDASNLVANDTNGKTDIFIKDLVTGAVTRVSTDASGGQSNGASMYASFSPDGSKVLFSSLASNLGAGDKNGYYDLFIKDLTTGEVTQVTNSSIPYSHAFEPRFSADETAIFFKSLGQLLPGDNNPEYDIYKYTLPGPSTLSQTMSGGSGDDTITGGLAVDKLYGDDGNDRVYGGGGADQLFGGAGQDLLDGGDGADRFDGGVGVDTLLGGAGNDYMDGGTGADIMSGGGDNDTFIVDNTGDQTIETATGGFDVVRASVDWTLAANTESLELQGADNLNGAGNGLANSITGTSGNNILDGGDGGDTLAGGFGNDRLIGGRGNDTMTGGFGGDTFVVTDASVISSKAGGGVLETDFIKDLNKLQGDKIDLSAIDADIVTGGDQAFHLVTAFTKHAGEMVLSYASSSNLTTLTLDVDGDGKIDYAMKITGDVHLNSSGWIL